MEGLLLEDLVAQRIEDRNRRAARHLQSRAARRRRRVPRSWLLGGLWLWHPRGG
jgi:hypothetical protein